ncbi:FecR domain-containing protein [Fibrella sp. HMF5335]|uniref:FecR domain-containing protein n=1 Tax=Fibrella rubiginis TaxID=2817060 RepID=A0A939K380_9BACT|nr:FecR domain-containing protein [Fibrella rubiginis]MBO0935363.1 FecR domain-containing protein [Fibrella rubiginis]
MATEPQFPIDDALLGKYLAGEASETEADQVRRWLTDADNQREFDRFARLWQAAARRPLDDGIDTDAAWQRVRSQLQRPAANVPTPASVKPVLQLPIPARTWLGRYGRVAAVVLLGGFGLLLWRVVQPGTSSQSLAMLLATTTTATRQLTLPDGSRITLNRNSQLTYPTAFADSSRDVTLMGEAFFEVAHDARHPFRVQAGQTIVRVLGTSFGVRVVGDSVRVAVRSGRVRVSAPREAVVLEADQQATYLAKGDTLRRVRPLDKNNLAYLTGRLTFANESLAAVVQTLRETYGADIRLSTVGLRRCRLSAEFDHEPLDTVLPVVAETLSLRLRRDGAAWVLVGEGCE